MLYKCFVFTEMTNIKPALIERVLVSSPRANLATTSSSQWSVGLSKNMKMNIIG